MRWIGRYSALLALSPLLVTATACGGSQPDPPPAGAKLCGATMARWWFDAVGAGDLSSQWDGVRLPMRPNLYNRASCGVKSGDKWIGRYLTEVSDADNIDTTDRQIARRPASMRFTAAGGKGSIDLDDDGRGVEVWWTCKSVKLNVELYRTGDDKKRLELAKTLTSRIAAAVGCADLPSD